MTDDLGRPARSAVERISGGQGVVAVIDGLKVIADSMREIAAQKTEQERIRRQAAVQIARVHVWRDVFLDYLDRAFDERRSNFRELFDRLDSAMAANRIEGVAHTLDAIVALAKSSPFKDLADLAAARETLRDKSKDFEF